MGSGPPASAHDHRRDTDLRIRRSLSAIPFLRANSPLGPLLTTASSCSMTCKDSPSSGWTEVDGGTPLQTPIRGVHTRTRHGDARLLRDQPPDKSCLPGRRAGRLVPRPRVRTTRRHPAMRTGTHTTGHAPPRAHTCTHTLAHAPPGTHLHTHTPAHTEPCTHPAGSDPGCTWVHASPADAA